MFWSYLLPADVVFSGTLQNMPGPPIFANYVVPNAVIAPNLGRDLAACGTRRPCTATFAGIPQVAVSTAAVGIPLLAPFTQFEGRRTEFNVRVGKMMRLRSSLRLQVNADVYNALNSRDILSRNNTFGPLSGQQLSVVDARMLQLTSALRFGRTRVGAAATTPAFNRTWPASAAIGSSAGATRTRGRRRERRRVGGYGHHVRHRHLLHDWLHQFGPRAAARPGLHIEQLAHRVAGRSAGKRRHRAKAFHVPAVADTALILDHELLPLLQGADRRVHGPPHARVTCFRAQVVVWHFHEVIADRFGAATLARRDWHVHSALEAYFGGRTRFDHLDTLRIRLSGEILRSGLEFLGRCRLGVRNHHVRVRLAGIGAASKAVLEILHLLQEVRRVQPVDWSVLGPPCSICEMAQTAGEHALLAVPDDRRLVTAAISGMPVGDLTATDAQCPTRHGAIASGDADHRVVIGRQSRWRRRRPCRGRRGVRPLGETRWHGCSGCWGTLLRHDHCPPEDDRCNSNESTVPAAHVQLLLAAAAIPEPTDEVARVDCDSAITGRQRSR